MPVMREIILLKNGEIALKGLNRHNFEEVLVRNARRRLAALGEFRFRVAQSTVLVEPLSDEVDLDEAVARLQRVFGFAALSRACVLPKEFEAIAVGAVEYLSDLLADKATFKVEAKRSDKSFPLTSPQICAELGGRLLGAFPHLRVDVQRPDVVVMVEIRDFGAYVHGEQLPGAGGLPVGTSGRGMLLISGGIDSPVAGYMMAKRGVELSAVHFVSPPYTSERARLKVLTLLEKMSAWCGRIETYIVPFTEIQEQIREHCPEEYFTLVMRRFMMRIAQRLAAAQGCRALITGESVAQVASQTMGALVCTDAVCQMPVFRPVIGMDKEEIIALARKIDTFETSILPYEDCCTVFTPRHPKTNPKLELVERAEQALAIEQLVEAACAQTEKIYIRS